MVFRRSPSPMPATADGRTELRAVAAPGKNIHQKQLKTLSEQMHRENVYQQQPASQPGFCLAGRFRPQYREHEPVKLAVARDAAQSDQRGRLVCTGEQRVGLLAITSSPARPADAQRDPDARA